MRTSLFKPVYNGRDVIRKSADDTLEVQILKTCKRTPGTFYEECISTAKEIYEQSKGMVWIAFSGGIDSEVVVNSFYDADVPFRVINLKLMNNDHTHCYNYHDVEYVSRWCYHKGIKPTNITLNLDHWINNRVYLDRALMYQVTTPAMVSLTWLCEQLPLQDTLVMGGEIYVRNCTSHWAFQLRENIDLGMIKYSLLSGRNFITDFFSYTPEAIVAFLNDPIIHAVWNNQVPGKLSLVSTKQAIYGKSFDIAPRVKYTGYEHVKKYEAELYNTVAEHSFPIINSRRVSFEVNEFIKRLQDENYTITDRV